MPPATVHHTDAVFSIVRWDLRTRTWRPYGWFGREYGYLGHISECHSSSSSSSWTRLWGEFMISEESSLNSVGQLFNETGKMISEQEEITGVSTKMQRFYVDVHDLILYQRLSDHQRQSLRLLRLCALCGTNGRWSYCNMARKTITSRIWIEWMVFRRSWSGKYSQESQRWALKIWWEIYCVNLSTLKRGSSSWQCTMTLYGEK